MLKKLTLLYTLLLLTASLSAQFNVRDSAITTHLISAHISFNLPAADLSQRFGGFAQVGPGYMVKTKNNLLLGIDGLFGFGNQVKNKDNILKNITTADGNIIDMEGVYATFSYNFRSLGAVAKAGKVISLQKPNPNSGIMLWLGAGYLQHKIYFDYKDKVAPQISGDYIKGYDELRQGVLINLFAGYLYMCNQRKINFYAGLDVNLAFTADARPYSFANATYLDGKFTDVYTGIKVAWFFPAYRRAPNEFYYY
ncbi:MAG: hypothetical protein PHX54_02125 [Lentimicrobiaceae bacterium]|nr:hypothetical protein [Lentimicrobiaceae bacterium]